MSDVEAVAVTRFLKAYMAAPDDADVEIRGGRNEEGERFLAVTIGADAIGLNLPAVNALMRVLEKTLFQLPNAPETQGFPNLILGLRHAVAVLASKEQE